MAVPHLQTLEVLENFLDSSPVGKYILGRPVTQKSILFLFWLSTYALNFILCALANVVIIPLVIVAIFPMIFLGSLVIACYVLALELLLQYQWSVALYLALKWVLPQVGYPLNELQVILYPIHKVTGLMNLALRHYRRLIIIENAVLQRLALLTINILRWCIVNLSKIMPFFNGNIVKLLYSNRAVDKMNISLTEYKNLFARTLVFFIQHGGVGPTQSLAQFIEALLTDLKTHHHYDDLQTLLRMGAYYDDFNVPALQYYQKDYLARIMGSINQELTGLHACKETFFSALPIDIAVELTGHFVAYNQYPHLASWMFNQIKAPEPVPGFAPVAAPGG